MLAQRGFGRSTSGIHHRALIARLTAAKTGNRHTPALSGRGSDGAAISSRSTTSAAARQSIAKQ